MANKKNKKSIVDFFNENQAKKGDTQIGDFPEHAGGGTPLKKGEKYDYVADNPIEAKEYKEDHPGSKVRTLQPIDPKTGKFTRNFANLRPREFPDRAKTEFPFFAGLKMTISKAGKASLVDIEGHKFALPEHVNSKDAFKKYVKEGVADFADDRLIAPLKGKGGKTPKMVLEIGVGYVEFKKASESIAAQIKGMVKCIDMSNIKSYKKKAKPIENTSNIIKPEKSKPEQKESVVNPFEEAKTDIENFKAKNSKEISDFYAFAEQLGYEEGDFGNDFWEGIVDMGITNFNELKEEFKKFAE